MDRPFPQRHNNHNLETLSERYFTNSLPRDWASDKLANDYGVDLRVDIFENGRAIGLELLVQLKSSANATEGNSETIRMDVATDHYLSEKIQVVMIVKYVEEVKEAYWILLKDIPLPNPNQQTFTIHIPKQNTLSTISWGAIKDHVREVIRRKMTQREQRIQRIR